MSHELSLSDERSAGDTRLQPHDLGCQQRHFLLCAVGSSGDVHPAVGIGRSLRKQGHQVTLLTAGYFQELALKEGFDFIDCLPQCDLRTVLGDPQIWHPWHGTRKIIELAVRPMMEPMFDAIRQFVDAANIHLVSTSLSFGARVAEEVFRIPQTTLHLSPALFRSRFEGPRLPRVFVHRGPGWFKQFQWTCADRFAIDPLICPWLNPFRSQHGLQPVRSIFGEWWNSPHQVLGMFPPWFAGVQPDWPAQLRLTGFPLYSEETIWEPSEELRAFLAEGEAPIVFTPGSANLFGHDFFHAAKQACLLMGRRGILLTRFPEQIPPDLPEHVRYFDYAPFRWLLPRASLLVHHGGIGSMSQAIAAGIPQIIMPMAFDQLDNASRIRDLGIGDWIRRKHFHPKRVAQIANRLLNDPGVTGACASFAGKIAEQDGIQEAVMAILNVRRRTLSE